jgi:hypothetical protein
MEKRKMKDLVWHYTKMDVLPKIFTPEGSEEYKKGEIKLRFTNIKFLNDPSEGLVFKHFFEKHRAEIANSLPKNLPEYLPKDLKEIILNEPITEDMMNLNNTYTFSTSRLTDSFAFWNKEYAGLNGFAIAFYEDIEDILEDKDFFIRDIEYINLYGKEKEFIEEDIIDYLFGNPSLAKALGIERSYSSKELLSGVIDIFSCLCKQKSWEHEKEVRIIKETPNAKIEFNANGIKKNYDEYFDKSIVHCIILGPECNDEQVKAVREYLYKNGYNDIKVRRSRAFELRNTDKLFQTAPKMQGDIK